MIVFDPPRRDYRVVYADPPWSYYGDPNKDQAAGKHYALMSTEAICALPVASVVRTPAVLMLWATSPQLDQAMRVMDAWGFHYRGVAYVWVKTRKDGGIINGQGIRPSFTKSTTELVLVGSTQAKGRPLPVLDEGQGQVVLAPRGEHSEKPSVVRARIRALFPPVPRLEMFARQRISGWDAWGDGV